MEPLLTSAKMRAVDKHAITTLGFPSALLMEHAALAIVDALHGRFGALLREARGTILAGPGNNGGDALAVARLLAHRGTPAAHVVLLSDGHALSEAAQKQRDLLSALGISVSEGIDEGTLQASSWVIDGLFGTGLQRPLTGQSAAAVEALQKSAAWVLAIDIPSGLSGDTGHPLGPCITAQQTVTLGFYKRGLVTGKAAAYVGKLSLATIQLPRDHFENDGWLYDTADAQRDLPSRAPTSNKGSYGHVYVWAGAPEKEGAAGLACLSALRTGTGLATLLGDAEALAAVRPRLPLEVMTQTADASFFAKAPAGTVCVLGPGLGTDENAWDLLTRALASKAMLLLDADALTLLANHKKQAETLLKTRLSHGTLLTPHPKEASRLLGCEVSDVETERFAAGRKLSDTYHAHVLLKGKGTVVTPFGEPYRVVTRGDSGLAKGGTGDTLCGIIAALLAQKVDAKAALTLGPWLHGRAAEWITERAGDERCTLASEISAALPEVFAELKAWRAK